MSETSGGMPSGGTVASETTGLVPTQLAVLVPTFDPSRDDLTQYTKKVQLLTGMWPEGKWTELATRLILGCQGSAFLKLQLHQTEVTKNERKSVQRIIELLGGHWGQINIERQYEYVERALFRCQQKGDESSDSYLARADIMWAELISRGIKLEDIQPYITLRGSLLGSDDKKRVLLDIDAAGSGKLSMDKVASSIRMLGAGFFHDVTGQRRNRGKTYDQTTLVAESQDVDEEPSSTYHTEGQEDVFDEDLFETLVQEGDEDASLIADFESAAADVLQGDDELASAYTAYVEARRRLNEKTRFRGFWPVSQPSKGKSKGHFKGKGRSYKGSSNRKSLQQRILESRCRICNRYGHWKAECPQRANQSENSSTARGSASQAPTSFVSAQVTDHPDAEGLPLEFLDLPSHGTIMEDPKQEFSLVCFGKQGCGLGDSKTQLKRSLRFWEDCNQCQPFQHSVRSEASRVREPSFRKETLRDRILQSNFKESINSRSVKGTSTRVGADVACFASHGSFGVVDLGATKTVIGSELLQDLIESLRPEVRNRLSRCPCSITFRFGNHGLLQSTHALVVPIQGYQLKVAIVPGSTPFLISSTLLRAIGAVIDTNENSIYASKIDRRIPLHLTEKGLFLLDLNELASSKGTSDHIDAETYAIDETKVADTVQPSQVHCSFQSFNPVQPLTNPIHQGENQKYQAPPEKSSQEHSEAESAQHSIGSSDFAKSFVVPERNQHVQPCQEIAKGANSSGTDCARFVPIQSGRVGDSHDRFRNSPSWRHVPTCMGHRSKVDPLVHQPLSQLSEDQPQILSSLRGAEGRTSRADWNEGAIDRTHRSSGTSGIVGTWEPLPESQGSTQDPSSGKGIDSNQRSIMASSTRSSCGRVSMDLRGGHAQCSGDSTRCEPPRIPDAEHGERIEPSDFPARTSHDFERPIKPRCQARLDDGHPELHALTDAGDISHESVPCKENLSVERSAERIKFNQLVQQYQREYNDIASQCLEKGPRVDIMEIFCGPDSQLSHQCQQLGFRAVRFGKEQCDLQTRHGREQVFRSLHHRNPKNVWFSPTCGPWSKWSSLNGNKSLQAWDDLCSSRLKHLEQIALGIVIFRHQRLMDNHFHWEQPRGSLMFKLPYLSEAFYYLLSVDFEMCTAGNLTDPQNGKPIRKGMTLMTTSRRLVDMLSRCRCQNNHEHQVIEGSTRVQGKTLNRSEFTERYPRKFARKVVQVLCKIGKPQERPYSQDLLFPVIDNQRNEASEQPAKRLRTSAIARPKLSRVLDVEALPWGKRQRCLGKTTPLDSQQEWQSLFEELHTSLPRVGKVTLDENGKVLKRLRELITDKEVRFAIACRGSSRTMAPPEGVAKGESPYRKCVYSERETGKLKVEEEWEQWEELSRRQLIRPSHCSRITITVFASNPEKIPSAVPHQVESSPVPENLEQSVPAMSNPSEIPELTSSQKCDLSSSFQEEAFRSLPKDEQSALLRAHRNLGHPSPERLSTILRQQGFRAEVSRAALQLRCSVCQESSQPKGSRPSTLRDEMDFNDRISVDGFKWTNSQGKNFHVYHVVDWATSFQAAAIAPSRSSTEAINTIINMWFCWAGAPGEMIVDAGTEFNSEEFSNFVQQHNVKLTTISPEAHFQNGRAERHGAVLQHMISRFDKEHPITTYQELHQSLWWCVQAKNSSSLRKGYAPEVLVLGKHTRLPGAVSSDDYLPAHLLAESDSAHGIQFRKQLEYRECARRAFHHADNDAALRKAVLRRSHPLRQDYLPGEWVMIWRAGKGALPGQWLGPMKVVVHENAQTVWTTMSSKLFRVAPEHIRPVSAAEAHKIRILPNEPSVSKIAQQIQGVNGQGVTQTIGNGDNSHSNGIGTSPQNVEDTPTPEISDPLPDNPESSEGQPDDEPGVPSHASSPSTDLEIAPSTPIDQSSTALGPSDIPVPDDTDDDLIVEGLYCVEDEADVLHAEGIEQAWRCEIIISEQNIQEWKQEDTPEEMAFLVSAAKKQRAEVRLSTLNSKERSEFETAKETEVQNWVKTGTVAKILRDKIPADQILKCRWIFTWKPLDEEDQRKYQKTKKAKARLVILGYLDPKIDQLPRDSPTLGRHSKMLMLQLIASMGWNLQSFDIKAAFLQGKPQTDRVLGVEPVPELIKTLQLQPNEVCKLEKGAYGLIDAPYMWYKAILEQLLGLGFQQSPFDPCVFILRDPITRIPDGILGLHVDDGLCGGNQRFQEVIDKLEKKYPFGSKRMQHFTFTGIEMNQHVDKSISLSQSTYVKSIDPIKISPERRKTEDSKVTEEERQDLRALIGSLQYAAVHTRPDLSSRLSFLQSDVNRASVGTLVMANQALHEAKRHSDVEITVKPITISDLRFLAFSDASFASKSNPNSHTGCIIMSTHKNISRNISCPVSPLVWGCKKIQRVVTSTLAAETVSLGTVLDQLSWIKLCWAWTVDDRVAWKKPTQALKELPEAISTATFQAQQLPESVAATDCKSLFDLVTRTAPPQCAEFRTQLVARSIKDMLDEGINLRWVHSGAQLADALTKIMESSFLRETLKHGRYRLHDELEVLKNRATSRNRIKWLKEETDKRQCGSPANCNDACFLIHKS